MDRNSTVLLRLEDALNHSVGEDARRSLDSMDIVGQIGYWLLVALAAILTLGVRTKLDAGLHTILGALFFVSGAVVITASGADKTHALWVIPSGFFIAVLMAYLSAQSGLLSFPFRVLASLFAAIVRIGIPVDRIRAAQDAELVAAIDEWALREEATKRGGQ